MGDPWAGLDDFHRAALDYVAEIEREENVTRSGEFERSIAREAALFESVSSRLAATAATSADLIAEPTDDPLMRACRLVGHFMGIEVRAPHRIGDESSSASRDPLGDLARASGFQVRPVTLADNWWCRGGDPLFGQLKGDEPEPVALLPVRTRLGRLAPRYELHDSHGVARRVDRTLAGLIAPNAWLFYRTLPDKVLRPSDLAGFSMGLPGLGHELAMVFAMALFGAILGLALPVASGIIVDQVLPAADLSRLGTVCLFLVVIVVASAIFQAIQGLLVMRIEGRVSATLIPAFWDRLLRLPSGFFTRFSSGDLASRAMELSEVFKKVSGATVATVVTGFFSFFNLALLYYYSWKLALGTTMLLAVLLCLMLMLLGGLLRFESSIRAIDGALSGMLLELLGGISTLRTAGAETRAFSRWARRYTDRLAMGIRARRFSSRIHRWLAVYPILTAMVVYIGALYIDPGLLDTGSFIAFNIALAALMAAVLEVGYTSIGLLELLPRYERLRPILDEKPEFAAAVLEPVRLAGALALEPRFLSLSNPGERSEGSRQRQPSGPSGRVRGHRRPVGLGQVDPDAAPSRLRVT